MEEDPPPPTSPFWLQPTTKRRPRLPSSTGFLVAMLCILAIVSLVLVIPSLISLTHQVFGPSSVKKSWDSLNLILILFAVVCGFLGRKDKDDQTDQDHINVSIPQSPLISQQQYTSWCDYEFGDQVHVRKLIRSSSSYPDLRQWDVDHDHRPRYYDDCYAINHRDSPRSLRSLARSRSHQGIDGDDAETIKLPTPPNYYLKIVKPPRKDYESINRRCRKAKISPPPPPPPPPLDRHQYVETRNKSATKEIITSIVQQSKRKNKLLKRKSHENLKDLLQQSPPPTPDPPPYPNLSPKKSKLGKKIISTSVSHPIPPKPTKFDHLYETIDIGYESPSIPIPPPPPPPPFKLHPWKFDVDGDYIKIDSSPRRSGGDESEFETFCSSPDVNTKADDFIARFKATLKLEKMKSTLGPDSSPSPSPHAIAISGLF